MAAESDGKMSILRYDQMVERALRGVVREALETVAATGLPGAHHFFITFRTDQPGAIVPEYLRQRYPREMTVVLQNQFSGLEVSAEGFAVTLYFNKVPERVTVPFATIVAFHDPSVKFALQFRGIEGEGRAAAPVGGKTAGGKTVPAVPAPTKGDKTEETPAEKPPGEVISLDAFRQKK